MSTDACPSESDLRAFHRGEAPLEVVASVGAHVELCLDCERRLLALDAEADLLVLELRDAASPVQDPPRLETTQLLSAAFTPHDLSNPGRDDAPLESTLRQDSASQDAIFGRGAFVRYFGDYEIREEIGRGGMGVVYRAQQVSLNRPVALKMMRSTALADGVDLRRFRNEAETVALLDHPNIVPIYEVGEHDGQCYLSMKYIQGGNLADRLDSFRDSPRAAADLMHQVCLAVHYAHRRGVLHRDLKPANVLLDASGHPHLTDFGLAKQIESHDEITVTGAILGTPAYMSPEQANGHRGEITTVTDVYGLGAILYALLTGRAPFGESSLVATLDAVRSVPPSGPTRLNSKIPRDLETICLKCLEKDPSDRYPSAAVLAEDLRRFSAGESVSVRPAGSFERAAKWARRKPTMAAACALGLLAMTLGSLGLVAARAWMTAERARGIADEARAESKTLRERAEQIEYGRTMQVAYQDWHDNRLARARQLLEGTRKDLRGWEWDYMDRLCHAEQQTIPTGNPIEFAAFSPDGRRFVTAGWRGALYVWDAADGRRLLELKGPKGPYWIGYSPDGKRIAARFDVNSGLLQGRFLMWDAITGAVALDEPDTCDEWVKIPGSPFSPDGSRITVSFRDEKRAALPKKELKMTHGVWSLANTSTPLWLGRHAGGVISAIFSPDGLRLLTGGRDGLAKVWDAKTGLELFTLNDPAKRVRASFSPDGRKILTWGEEQPKLWDAANGAAIRTMAVPWLSVAEFSRDGTQIAGVTHHNQAAVIEVDTGLVVLLKGHTAKINQVCFSPDGTRVLTASDDQTARLWDARTGDEVTIFRGHTAAVTSASFSPDGSRILSSGLDGQARIWSAVRRDVEFITLGSPPQVPVQAGHVLFSPDGSRLLTSGKTGMLWDARTGDPLLTLKGWDNFLNKAAFFPDGRHVISSIRDYRAAVWNVETGDLLTFLGGHSQGVEAAAVSRDSSRIATASNDGSTNIYDGARGLILRTLQGHTQAVSSLEFSADGSQLLTASFDGTARIWDVEYGRELRALVSQEGVSLKSARFSPDGRRIVTAGISPGDWKGWASVWDTQTGTLIHTLRTPAGLFAAAYSPDGRRIVTSGQDDQLRIWDASSGVEVLSLKGHHGEVSSVEFSPDGTSIASACNDGTVKIWDSTPLNPEILARRPVQPSSPRAPSLESRLSAILRGSERPAHLAERITCFSIAFQTQRFAASLRLVDKLLEANPSLLRNGNLPYNGACAGVLASTGAGKDDPAPDAAERTALRRRGFQLIRALLDEMTSYLRTAPPNRQAEMIKFLRHWKSDPDLASVREPADLDKLPVEDQAEWRTLWAKTDALIKSLNDAKSN